MTMRRVMRKAGQPKPVRPGSASGIGAITLRNLPPALATRLLAFARERGLSLNRAVIELLGAQLGTTRAARSPVVHDDDLGALAGTWSAEQADEFDRALQRQRQIEPEIWTAPR